MTIAVSVISAVLPSLLLVWFFYSQDVNRHVRRTVLITFLLGILIVFPVAALEVTAFADLPLGDNPYVQGLVRAFWTAAIPEEMLKFLVVVLYCARLRNFGERMDGMVYGSVASLGFAAMENVVYVTAGGLALALSRAFTAVPCHAFLGAIMGFYVGQARFDSGRRGRLLATGLFVAILFHGLYDFPLLTIQAMNVGNRTLSQPEIFQISALTGLTVVVLFCQGAITLTLQRDLRLRQLRVKARLQAQVRAKLFQGYL
jgi:RsiW-degrading membrane proteinase PrsW (M82 family)